MSRPIVLLLPVIEKTGLTCHADYRITNQELPSPKVDLL